MGNIGKVVAVANQKGGVGKTTTAVNLTAALHKRGFKTLLLDFDPQGNATTGYGVKKNDGKPTVYDLLVGACQPKEAVRTTPYGDAIPSNTSLAGANMELIGDPNRAYKLRDAIKDMREDYDFIIMDCPPSLEMLTINALCAADSILVPLQCEYYALEGLSELISTIRMVRKGLNKNLEIEGILFTMFDSRTKLALQVVNEVKKHFGDKLYKTVIPRNIRLSEAPSHGKPIMYYDRFSRGSDCYDQLAEEFSIRATNGNHN